MCFFQITEEKGSFGLKELPLPIHEALYTDLQISCVFYIAFPPKPIKQSKTKQTKPINNNTDTENNNKNTE